jgi:lactoylglutathione lyase
MTVSLNVVGAITLFVDDVQRSKAWYANVFERTVVFEDDNSAVFKLENLLVNLLQKMEANELIAPAEVTTPRSGSYSQLTIWVDDVDGACATLAARGVEPLNGPMNRDWGQRTACFADPDGHLWELAQTI